MPEGALFFISGLRSFLFYLLKLPIPWLLGSLVFVFMFQFFSKIPVKWDVRFRNYGLMVVGFSIGHIFTLEILKNILCLFPFMLLSNILLILFSILMAYVLHLSSKVDFSTMLVANVPGDLSQMILFAEETNRLNVPIVTYFQVLRVFLVVLPILFIVTLHSSGNIPIESATTV